MSEPVTPNIGLIVPNTGDLPGAWGTSAVNPNMTALDGLFGGVTALSLGAATTITLSASTAVVTPSAGPFQSNNAVIGLSGTLSGNAVIKVSVPGRYVFDNRCLGGVTNYVQIAPSSGGGNACGVPPGKKTTFFFDGTNVDFVDLGPEIGGIETVFLGGSGVPAWIAACTVPPFININGPGELGPVGATTFSSVTYPALFDLLATTHLPVAFIGAAGEAYSNFAGIVTFIRAA